MNDINLEILTQKLILKRGSRGIRKVAKEIGVAPSTISRVEKGNLPDLETFKKLCAWVNIDANEVLGINKTHRTQLQPVIHFRKKRAISKGTAQSLGKMILAFQQTLPGKDYDDEK